MAVREIKLRDHSGDLVGRQNGMAFLIRTEPDVIAGTPAHSKTILAYSISPHASRWDKKFRTYCCGNMFGSSLTGLLVKSVDIDWKKV